jgi:hypothetical protein
MYTTYGLQRSGTNFLEGLIRQNVKQGQVNNMWRSNNGIWKHAFDIENHKLGGHEKLNFLRKNNAIWIHKHPYSWIESVTRKHVDLMKTQEQYVKQLGDEPPWQKMGNFRLGGIIELWNKHTRYWWGKLHTTEYGVYHLPYERLVKSDHDTKQETIKFIDHFKGERKNPDDIIIPGKVGQSGKFTDAWRDKYLNIKLELLTWQQVQFINERIDREMCKRLGYILYEYEVDYQPKKIGRII